MPVAPGRRPIATGKDAVMIAGHQCAPRSRRNRAARVADFPLELAEPGDPRDGGVTGEPANRLGRHRAAPLEPTGGGPLPPRPPGRRGPGLPPPAPAPPASPARPPSPAPAAARGGPPPG